MTTQQKTIRFSIVLLSMVGASPLFAADVDRSVAVQINAANGLLRDGDVDGAIAAYQRVQQLGPPPAALTYNHAVAQYRKGDVAAAAEQFKSVAASDDDAIAAKARFNLGNCDYVSALQLAEKDRPAAIGRLESAIRNYRSALEIKTSDAEARANIELASQMIDKLRKEEEREQQQPDQQQGNQQNQQQNSENQQEDQQNQQQQSGQQGGEQQQDKPEQQDQQNQSPSESQQQNEPFNDQEPKDDQSKEEQPSQDNSASEQQDQQKDSESENQPKTATQPPTSQNRNQQNSADNDEDESPTGERDQANQEQGQEPPKGELSVAAESEQDDAADQQRSATRKAPEKGEMTQEEAEKMLQAIRDRDMIRRLRRQAAERNQHIPVDRDW